LQNGSILLVEDNPDDELLTIDALAAGEVRADISVVRDGVEAIDFLFARGEHSERSSIPLPKLVLLDLKLPRMGGLQVLQQIRSDHRTKRLPVVVLTSSLEHADLSRAYDLGANSYLQKPVEFDSFTDIVKILGLYWLVHNRVPRES
jgi:two-component system response regulator